MRTVIFLGLIFIGSCINPTYGNDETASFLSVIAIVAMGMDITEFINKLRKK